MPRPGEDLGREFLKGSGELGICFFLSWGLQGETRGRFRNRVFEGIGGFRTRLGGEEEGEEGELGCTLLEVKKHL